MNVAEGRDGPVRPRFHRADDERELPFLGVVTEGVVHVGDPAVVVLQHVILQGFACIDDLR